MMGGRSSILLVLAVPILCSAQVTIRVSDLEYPVGGYYLLYDIPSPQGVIGLTGIVGGPHVFNFSSGPTVKTLTFDYVETSDGGHGGDFPSAEVAERKTENSDLAWLYLSFDQGIGRIAYGFYDSVGLPESPSVPFTPPIVDFPDSITYGSWFTGSTSFDVVSSGLDLTIDYTFTGFVDAYGSIILPENADTFECLQVNYYEEYVYLWMGIPIQYSYIRSYYYLTKETGISVIITSLESETPIPNDFNVAQTVARLYDSSKLQTEPPVPLNLEVAVVGDSALLTWQPGAGSRDVTYNVYSSPDPYRPFDPGAWNVEATGVESTTWTDEGISEEMKFYRVTAEN